MFQKELETISSSNKNIKVIYTVTHSEESKTAWTGKTGRISKELIEKYIPNVSSSLFYIAGSPVMVKAIEELVKGMGIASEQIKIENFVGY